MTEEKLHTVTRFDSIKMPRVRKTKGGFIRGESIATRAGVFIYRNANGSIQKELRHPNEVFHEDSLETLEMLPVTLDHPKEFVDASNAHKYDIGSTGENYRIEGDHIAVTLIIKHQDAIDAINDGKHEISMGYYAELIADKGIYNGEEYDFRQTNIRYNHLAIVDKGRAGSIARLKFDSAAELIAVEVSTSDSNINSDSIGGVNTQQSANTISNYNDDSINNIPTSTIQEEDTKPMKEKEETKNMDSNTQFKLDALDAENKQVKTENELLKEKFNNLQAKLDCLEKSYKQLSQDLKDEKAKKTDSIINSKVDDKVDLLVRSAPYLDDLNAYLRHSPREIMIKVINAKNDEQDFSDKDDSYIKGKFDSITGVNNKTRRDHAEVFAVLKKHNDHAISGDRSDHMFSLMQDIKQKRMAGN